MSATAAAESTITARPIGATFGAVVEGVDFDHLTPAVGDQLNRLILEHAVLVFESVHPSKATQEEFARLFGEPHIYPLTKFANPDGDIWTEFIDTADSPPDADNWHTDLTWVEEQPKFGVLTALDVPEVGGYTMWADCYAAYDALSPPMRELCEKLVLIHEIGANILVPVERQGGPKAAAFLRERFPGIRHPLVRAHPETGRRALLLAGGFMKEFEGMHAAESKLLLDWLRRHIDNPNFHLVWDWKPGDLIIWDERCTNHRGLSSHYPQYRRLRRCTVQGHSQFAGI